MFSGRHDHSLDEKGRTMVPRDFRAVLESLGERAMYITFALGKPRRLEVRPASSFEAFQARFTKGKKNALLERFGILYFGGAERVELDKAGRILVPSGLRKKARLLEKVAFVGIDGDRFQLWRPEDLDDVYAYCDEHADEIQDALSDLLDGLG